MKCGDKFMGFDIVRWPFWRIPHSPVLNDRFQMHEHGDENGKIHHRHDRDSLAHRNKERNEECDSFVEDKTRLRNFSIYVTPCHPHAYEQNTVGFLVCHHQSILNPMFLYVFGFETLQLFRG